MATTSTTAEHIRAEARLSGNPGGTATSRVSCSTSRNRKHLLCYLFPIGSRIGRRGTHMLQARRDAPPLAPRSMLHAPNDAKRLPRHHQCTLASQTALAKHLWQNHQAPDRHRVELHCSIYYLPCLFLCRIYLHQTAKSRPHPRNPPHVRDERQSIPKHNLPHTPLRGSPLFPRRH